MTRNNNNGNFSAYYNGNYNDGYHENSGNTGIKVFMNKSSYEEPDPRSGSYNNNYYDNNAFQENDEK